MRVAGWPQILADRVEHWRDIPLVYGESDCLQFCADVVQALTGEDHSGSFPAYSSQLGAAKILVEAGGIKPLISAVLGKSKHPSKAMRGDVVVSIGADGMECAGICLGVNWAGPTESGIGFFSMTAAVAAWTV